MSQMRQRVLERRQRLAARLLWYCDPNARDHYRDIMIQLCNALLTM